MTTDDNFQLRPNWIVG